MQNTNNNRNKYINIVSINIATKVLYDAESERLRVALFLRIIKREKPVNEYYLNFTYQYLLHQDEIRPMQTLCKYLQKMY